LDEFAWASAVGRIRVMEKRLLRKQDLLQLLESKSLETAMGQLRDSTYGPYISKLENVEAFNGILQEALRDSYDYATEISPEPLVTGTYRARYDFHNMKVLVKARLLGIPEEREASSDLGNLEISKLAEIIESLETDESGTVFEDYEEPNEKATAEFRTALLDSYVELRRLLAEDACKRTKAPSPLELDSFIDRAYYKWAKRMYERFGYRGLVEFLSSETDILNLKMLMRAKRLRIPEGIFKKIVLPGGTVPDERLVEVYDKDLSKLVRLYRKTQWEELARSGVSVLEREDSLTMWEKECDNALMRLFKRAKILSIGPEPVIGYIAGRETEVKNLRIILSGKQSLVPAEVISERLRETYV